MGFFINREAPHVASAAARVGAPGLSEKIPKNARLALGFAIEACILSLVAGISGEVPPSSPPRDIFYSPD
jgi:hypothetical protein